MKSDIYKHLETLSEPQILTLLKDDSTCLSVFRNLPPLAQHVLLRALYIDKRMYKNHVAKYSMTNFIENRALLDKTLKVMENLRLIQLEKAPQNDEIELITIDSDFKEKLKEVVSEGAKLSLLKESHKTYRNIEKYDSIASAKFNSLLNYLVGQPAEITTAKDLLVKLKLISKSGDITKAGFKFLLNERPAQVNQLIMQCIEHYKEVKYPIEKLLKLLFNMHLTLPGKFYVLAGEAKEDKMCEEILNAFEDLGLIYRRSKAKPKKFMKTSLLNKWQEVIPPKEVSEEEKFLIVESNYRYVAYTNSPYHKSLLNMFSRVDYAFPNMIIGVINNKTVVDALLKGITADQICFYMKKHGRYQIEPENIDPKLSVVPENVLHQIRLWEEDLQCIKAQDGVLITGFDTLEKYKKFLEAAKRAGIFIYAADAKRAVVCKGTSEKIKEMYSKI